MIYETLTQRAAKAIWTMDKCLQRQEEQQLDNRANLLNFIAQHVEQMVIKS